MIRVLLLLMLLPSIAWGTDSPSVERLLYGPDKPSPQVLVYTSDSTWECPPCERFAADVLEHWKKQGWPVGGKPSDLIRTIPCRTGPVPYLEIVREGKVIAKHTGYMSRTEFEAWTRKHLPEWYETQKAEQPAVMQKTSQPAWDYQSKLLLGN